MIIPSRNTLASESWVPKTRFTHTEAAAVSVVRWENPNGFSASWAIQLGETGEEQTEVVLLNTSAPSGTAGTLTANTLYEHPADTPIYGIKYDKVVFEVSTAGTAGTASPLTDGTVTYQADSDKTIFDDTSGDASYAYKTYFRNSVLDTNSTESDWITSAGFSFYSLAKLTERIKNKLWDASFIKEDETIHDWINEWKDEMVNEMIQSNEDYALGTTDVGFDGTNGYGTVTTTDFSQIRRVWVTYNGADYYRSTKMNVNDFIPTQSFNSTHPYHYWLGDTIFGVKPEESGGTARLVFYRFGTPMVNDTDELPLPMRGFTRSFIDYGQAQALFKDGKTLEAQSMLNSANLIKERFKTKIAPRLKDGVTYVDIVEGISGEDDTLI